MMDISLTFFDDLFVHMLDPRDKMCFALMSRATCERYFILAIAYWFKTRSVGTALRLIANSSLIPNDISREDLLAAMAVASDSCADQIIRDALVKFNLCREPPPEGYNALTDAESVRELVFDEYQRRLSAHQTDGSCITVNLAPKKSVRMGASHRMTAPVRMIEDCEEADAHERFLQVALESREPDLEYVFLPGAPI